MSNDNFSREYLYQMSRIKGRILTAYFIPKSDAFIKYGNFITIVKVIDDENNKLLYNVFSKMPINTSGEIKCLAIVKDALSEPIEVIFDTKDVYEVANN